MDSQLSLSFSTVRAKNAKPADVTNMIAEVLEANNDACWKAIQAYVMPPGRAGSKEYDHCEAVTILLKHDEQLKKKIHTFMAQNSVSKRGIWDYLAKTIKKAGFEMANGRVIGILDYEDDIA